MVVPPGIALLTESLTKLGFRKRASLVFTYGDGEQMGWLGLNTASHGRPSGELLIHPVVGVRHRSIEEWVARGTGRKAHSYMPPTVSQPLYVVAQRGPNEWVLNGGPEDPGVVDDLVTCVATAGMAFISTMSDISAAIDKMVALPTVSQEDRYRWPVALCLAGRPDDAILAIVQVREWLEGRSDPAASELRQFLGWLQADITTAH